MKFILKVIKLKNLVYRLPDCISISYITLYGQCDSSGLQEIKQWIICLNIKWIWYVFYLNPMFLKRFDLNRHLRTNLPQYISTVRGGLVCINIFSKHLIQLIPFNISFFLLNVLFQMMKLQWRLYGLNPKGFLTLSTHHIYNETHQIYNETRQIFNGTRQIYNETRQIKFTYSIHFM